jgi:hypothetical protein
MKIAENVYSGLSCHCPNLVSMLGPSIYIYEMMHRFTLDKISEIHIRLLRNDGSTQTIREEDKRRIQLDQKVDVFAYYNGCSLFENT